MILSREEHRERQYRDWLGKQGYEDTDERRALWFRRYERPAPPEGLFNNLEDITRKSNA